MISMDIGGDIEPIENIEQLGHLGWQLAVARMQEEEEGEVVKRTENAGLTAEQLAEIRESVDDITGYLPATVVVLLDEVERLQGEVRRLREALETLIDAAKDVLRDDTVSGSVGKSVLADLDEAVTAAALVSKEGA